MAVKENCFQMRCGTTSQRIAVLLHGLEIFFIGIAENGKKCFGRGKKEEKQAGSEKRARGKGQDGGRRKRTAGRREAETAEGEEGRRGAEPRKGEDGRRSPEGKRRGRMSRRRAGVGSWRGKLRGDEEEASTRQPDRGAPPQRENTGGSPRRGRGRIRRRGEERNGGEMARRGCRRGGEAGTQMRRGAEATGSSADESGGRSPEEKRQDGRGRVWLKRERTGRSTGGRSEANAAQSQAKNQGKDHGENGAGRK